MVTTVERDLDWLLIPEDPAFYTALELDPISDEYTTTNVVCWDYGAPSPCTTTFEWHLDKTLPPSP